MDKHKTVVIFRKWKNNEVIALFPEEMANDHPAFCSSYQHIGQHGVATPQGVINETSLAKEEEYQELSQELSQLGYNLDIRTKYTHKMFSKRVEVA